MALGVATMLSSCFLPAARPQASEPSAEPGISREAAAELLDAVPGLKLSSVGSLISGLSTEAVVEVYLDDDASILADGVLDYVLRVGWATKLPDEPDQISLSVVNGGTLLDLQEEANAIAGVDQEAYPLLHSVHLNPAHYLGAWPGAVPAPPTATVPATVPAPAAG